MKDNNSMLVSVIVISYNSSKFVIETLESIKVQTYKNIELIISDDCSTDNTIEMCENWLVDNSKRFVASKIITSLTNTGVSANVNRGVFNSTGEWFKLIAGDDLLTPNCILENIKFIVENQRKSISIVSSDISYFKVINSKVLEFDKTKNSILNSKNITAEQQYNLFLRGYSRRINSLFIKSEAYLKVGGCDETFKLKEDGPLIGRLLKLNYKIYYLNGVLFKYRNHLDSITGVKRKKIISDFDFNDKILYPMVYLYPNVPRFEAFIVRTKVSICNLFYKFNFLNSNILFNRFLYKFFLLIPDLIYSHIRKNYLKKVETILCAN
jgi:glycosyltransferase involved in cell wall biosynthesis